MLLVGCCNPKGERASYNGLWYTQNELSDMVSEGRLTGIPVKTEHTGSNVGTVISSFLDSSGALQCIMDIDETSVEGALTSGFVRDGIAADLSLGYTVDVMHTDNRLKAGEKRLLEISIVRKGAREGCHIQAYQDPGQQVVYLSKGDPWASFDLS